MVEVYFGGLPYSASTGDLVDAARQIVPEATGEVRLDRMTGRSRGFGLIAVPDFASAQRLVEAYDGKEFGGRVVTVNEASPLAPRQQAAVLEPLGRLAAPAQVLLASRQVSATLIEHFADHPEAMKLMPHRRFEELIARVWERFGYEVELTTRTRDGGIDIIAVRETEVKTRYLIQCKRLEPHNKVSIEPVRELFGVKADVGASKAILATTVFFTRDAIQFIDRHRWELEGRDYDGVVSWLNQARLGSERAV